jgi:lactoylglutathione lyase
MKFCWTTIKVRDIKKSLSFYQEVIGLKLNKSIKPNEEMEIAFLGDGDTQVELIYYKNNSEINFGKDISLGFEVESTDKFTEFLNTRGIKIHSGPFQPNPSIRFIYIQDPDGLMIQLVENITR